jgi:hypothetical protein
MPGTLPTRRAIQGADPIDHAAIVREAMINSLLSLSPQIRYVAVARGQEVESRERPDVGTPSAADSDRFEELLVNPTLLTLARQRGEIDCGGIRFLVVGYGNFHQLVMPFEGGHVSIAFELDADPLDWLDEVADVLRREGRG